MAEQTSHNVVINSESARASALVDAAANASTTDSAPSGKTNHESLASTSNSAVDSVRSEGPAGEQAGSHAPSVAAEPSAGEAAGRAALDSRSAKARSPALAHSELANGGHEDGSLADENADDKSVAGGSVDLNVNSDTDNSRADAGEKGAHTRTSSSVKKPAAFSKVNATKAFMSKIAPTATAAGQTGDKPNPASAVQPPANRPRLIAKTGTSQSMLKPRVGAASGGAPDASKVWNKNQPVAAPPPKQLTDEELKQQFGIHLATRLQTDGDKKDSNWADIDDDEDDWAPDTVVWMDGTKSTVPKDATPVPGEDEKKPVTPQIAKPADGVKPTLAVKQRSERPEKPMRILKPGAAAMQTSQNGGLSAASPAGQKAALSAKSPATAPAKSPWAPVPKPDSVAPINPPVQMAPPPRALPSQDARAGEPMAPPQPAREIAADTFDRSWQQRESGARELFNSANGRYEPAPEGRRGSIRQDNSRKPAVLQRPSQALSPAPEPSAAFQTRGNSQLDGSWGGRRRGSSVSQGSMPPPRRMSVNKPGEFAATPEAPSVAERPSNDARTGGGRPNFNQQSAWDQQMPAPPVAQQAAPEAQAEQVPPPEDPVKVQERIMQAKREAAKRRKEEEAREEAERKERLKAKLAALEGAGKSRSERAAEAAAKVTEKPVEKPADAVKSSAAEETQPAKALASTSAPSQSPATLDTPALGQEHSTEKLTSPPPPQAPLAGLPARDDSSRAQAPLGRTPASRAPFGTQQTANYRAPTSSYSSPGDRKSQPAQLGRSPATNSDAFSPWPTAANSNSGIWGTGFGNGVFDAGSAFAPMATSQQNSSLPPPPGMSRAPGSARISPQGFNQDSRSPSIGHPQVSEQQRAFPAPGMGDRSAPFGPAQPRLSGVSPSHAPGYGRPHHPPGPIGPPSRAQMQNQQPQNQHQQQSAAQAPPPAEVAAWNAAGDVMAHQYSSQHAGVNVPAPRAPAPEHRFKETFKKTSAEQGKLGGPRKFDAIEHTIHDGSGSRAVASFSSPAPPSTQTQPIDPPPAASPAHDPRTNTASGSTVRMPDPSQNPAHGGLPRPIAPPHRAQAERMQQQRIAQTVVAPLAPNVASKEQFAPPPEIERHPVYEGDARHPQVRLPKPQAKVRLPPASPQGSYQQAQARQQGSVVMPAQRQSFRAPGPAQPLVASEQWQQRFNGLFGRAQLQTEAPPSPPKTPPKAQGLSLAVASSSIEPMPTQTEGATVSLPLGRRLQQETLESVSKPDIDFSNERSFGSMPVVKVPGSVRYAPDVASTASNNTLKMSPNSKLTKTVDSGYREPVFFWRSPLGIFVNIPFTRLHNKLCQNHNHVPQPRPARSERKPHFNQRHQQEVGNEQQHSVPRNRKQQYVDARTMSEDGSRKLSQPFKNQQQQPQVNEERKPNGKFGNKKFDNRENRKATDASATSTPMKAPSGSSSKRSSVHVAKEQKPQTPPPAKAAPMSAKEATTEKRKSGVTKPTGTPSASANRFDLLAAMGSPSKN